VPLILVRKKHEKELSSIQDDIITLRSGQAQMSHQKILRYFQFVTSYPLTGSGKVQKFVLRENAIKAWDLEILKQK
jgi:acyl-CoA synthetase (AMP-forming)/AMP-acid ligase II